MDQESLEQIKHYLRSLKKVIEHEYDFKLFGRCLVKKNKIDDVYVCLLAVIPEHIKQAIKSGRFDKVSSVVYFKSITRYMKNKFKLSNDVYLVYYDKTIRSIEGLIISMKKDFGFIEKQL